MTEPVGQREHGWCWRRAADWCARASRHIPGDMAGRVQALRAAGVDAEYIWTDWRLAGRGPSTPGRELALDTARTAFVRRKPTILVLTRWARLAHSAGDLCAVLDSVSEIAITIVVDQDPYRAARLQHLVAPSRCW